MIILASMLARRTTVTCAAVASANAQYVSPSRMPSTRPRAISDEDGFCGSDFVLMSVKAVKPMAMIP